MINRIKRSVRDYFYRAELRKQIQACGGFAPRTDTIEMLHYRLWRIARVGNDRFDTREAGKLATWFAVSEPTAQMVLDATGTLDDAAKALLYSSAFHVSERDAIRAAPDWFATPDGLRHWLAWQVCAPSPAAWAPVRRAHDRQTLEGDVIKPEQLPIGAKLTRIFYEHHGMPRVDVLTVTDVVHDAIVCTDKGLPLILHDGELCPTGGPPLPTVRLFRPSDLAIIAKIDLVREARLSVDMPIGWLLLSDETLRAIIGERKQSHERLAALEKELKE